MEERLEGRSAGGGMRAVTSQYWRDWCGRATMALALFVVAPVVVCGGATCVRADDATLTFDVLTLTFPSADPDVTPEIPAGENPVTVSVKVRAAATAIIDLTATAAGDLISGADIIPIDRVRWIAAGQGFVSGSLKAYDPQLVGQWFGKRTDVTGTLSFRLQNSWQYASGFYSQVVVYTLVSY